MRKHQIARHPAEKQGLLDILLSKIRACGLRDRQCPLRALEVETDARTSITLKSLVTTVATPRKNVGRVRPSI